MSNREIVIELLGKLPADTPFEEIAREIELLAGIQKSPGAGTPPRGHSC
jgi:hypothetical protein